MSNGAQRANDERLVRNLIRDEWITSKAPEHGPAEPSPLQIERGLAAVDAFRSGELDKAIAIQVAEFPAVRLDRTGAATDVRSQVFTELVRTHAERGCESLPAMAATIAWRRAHRAAEVLTRQQDLLAGDDKLATATPWWTQGETTEAGIVDALDRKDQEALMDELSVGLSDRARQVYVVTRLREDLSEEAIAGCLPAGAKGPVKPKAVKQYRHQASTELRAMALVVSGEDPDVLDDETVPVLVDGILRRLACDEVTDLTDNVRGQVKRLARHLIAIGH